MADQAKETEGTPPEKHHLRDGSMKSEVENAILSGKAEGLEPGRETYASIMATNKPNPRGPGYIKLYLLAGMIFLCSTMNGERCATWFDSSLMGSINALPNYTKYFGLPENGNASTGIVFAIFQVGQMCGALFIWMADWYGRTWHIFFGCLGVCIGTIVTSMATNLPMFIGGRFMLSFFATLVAQDRYEEARGIIAKYHTNGDLNHPLVALQMKEMIGSLEETHLASWKDLFDLKVLVETRSARYRLMLNIAFSWFGQFSGNNIASYYLPLMLNNVGVTDTDTKLILNIVYAVIGWVFSATGSRLHDIVGRRKMLMATTAGMAICLALVAACAAGFVEYGNTTASTVSIVFIFMFGAVFSIGYTPMQPIYPAEVVSNKMRAKAMGTFKLTAGAAGFLNTFVGPIALSNIGYWFYVFFVFWDTFELGFMYFFFVETKGMTLEELDAIFEAKNPRKASVAAKKTQNRILKGGIAGV
ncbi:hypothetical protein FQN53_004966 [Emmonsiellopsis sp. PD_33]|nr:hypothetical protein FQN53_004966 [Emmonsiellopsis sp. PD_33]